MNEGENVFNDIFIDTDAATKFANPPDNHYKRLIKWLLDYDGVQPSRSAYLAICKKLLGEYNCIIGTSVGYTNTIGIIIDICTRQGRFNFISNNQIKTFRRRYFKERIVKSLGSNKKDHDYIAVIMLSDRKYALTLDKELCKDINNFPGFSAIASNRPQGIPFDEGHERRVPI